MSDERTSPRPTPSTGIHGSIQYTALGDGPDRQGFATVQPCVRYRYVMSAMTFFGFFMAQATRSFFNIAMVAMVNYTETPQNTTGLGCPDVSLNYTPAVQTEGEFTWDSHTQDLLLSGFYYGYVVTQFPGGYLADRYGGARVFGVAVFVPGVITLLFPTLARWDYRALLAGRILIGIIQGPLYPASQAIWSKWAPEYERSRLTAMATSGSVAGIVVSMVSTGYLCDLPYFGGWPLPFYVFGIACCVWALVWLVFSADFPSHSRWVSPSELAYIEQQTNSLDRRKYKLPSFLSLLRSKAVWALWIYLLCDGLGYYVMFSTLPIYMKQVLGFDISQDGVISALPQLLCFFFCMAAGPAADAAIIRWPHSRTTVRKLFTCIGEGSMAVAMALIGLSDCNHVLVVSFLIVGYGLNGLGSGGIGVIILDMAPQHAGMLYGSANTVGNIGGFISPLIVDVITQNQDNKSAWQLVFYLTSGIYGLGIVAFLILGSAEVEPWAKLPPEDALLTLSESQETDDSTQSSTPTAS